MANTYTQILIQYVFVVMNRQSLIQENIRENVEKYICGIIKKKKSKPLAIYCNPDHTHILIGLNPMNTISQLARDIKSSSAKWINANNKTAYKFNWQPGYAAFSYAQSQLQTVTNYILNQGQHHKQTSFQEEYLKLLNSFNIAYDRMYLFDTSFYNIDTST